MQKTPEFSSPLRGSGSKNNRSHLNSTQNLDSLGVTFLNSPSKPPMDVLQLLDLTSPSKNTRLQTRLGLCCNSMVDAGFRRSLLSKLTSPVKGEAPTLQKSIIDSPAKGTQMTEPHNKLVQEHHMQISANFVSPSKRKPTVLTRPDSSVSDEGQHHVGPPSSLLRARNSISSPIKNTPIKNTSIKNTPVKYTPIKNTLVSASVEFDSPAKNLRFKAKCSSSTSLLAKKSLSQSTDSNYMSPIKQRHMSFTQPDFTSPAKNTRLQLWRQSDPKGARDEEVLFDIDAKPLTNVDIWRIASFERASPTFGPCKRHLPTDSSSPVFKSMTVCTNALQTMSQVETAVVGKARKRLHMSPDCRI